MMSKYKLATVPSLLLIAGEHQNVGKTTLACSIISKFSGIHFVIGLKITPHLHANTGNAVLVESGKNWKILEESPDGNNKDTSRMMKAGAKKAFLMVSETENLETAIRALYKHISQNDIIVCESAGLREIIIPGIFIFIKDKNSVYTSNNDNDLMNLADVIINFNNSLDLNFNKIKVIGNKWVYYDKI